MQNASCMSSKIMISKSTDARRAALLVVLCLGKPVGGLGCTANRERHLQEERRSARNEYKSAISSEGRVGGVLVVQETARLYHCWCAHSSSRTNSDKWRPVQSAHDGKRDDRPFRSADGQAPSAKIK